MVTKPMTDPNVQIRTPRDPNTLSNYHNYVTRHTSVDFEIDFEKKRLVGSVVLRLESLVDEEGVDVVLDSRYVFEVVICQITGTEVEYRSIAPEANLKTASSISLKLKSTTRAPNSAVENVRSPMGAR
jgi:aminopeptidase N